MRFTKREFLHRDLKPANIIIDSNGKARITDFGIAGIEADVQGAESRVGTPAYMSPEQITGKEVTTRSDIYSLGLFLYEIYTGKQAMQADSFEELLEKQKTTQPTNPSKFVENIDPIVEKTINRCLEKDPNDRPKSALQVALALPGGNPLEAAIAAGETPSPEMVAAAPKKGALKPLHALGIFAAFVATCFGLIAMNLNWMAYSFTPIQKSPEVLAEKSREILLKLGYAEKPVDTDFEFVQDETFIQYYGLADNKHGLPPRKKMLEAGQPFDMYFLYRQSPGYLEPVDSIAVSEYEPPLTLQNMINLKLDARGRMFEFIAVPPQTESGNQNGEIEWREVFTEAGLDFGTFTESESQLTPPVFADKRRAWTGGMVDYPEIPIRVETAEFSGKLVFFRVVAPWNSPEKENFGNENSFRKFGIILLILSFAAAFVGSFVLAYRNIMVGRGDMRGGLKLTSFLFLVALAGQVIQADHIPTIWGELSIIYEAISYAVVTAIVVGLMYFALEPFVRRSWSEMLISWSRLISGDFRDPMVGRDILVGGLMGFGHLAGIHIGMLIFQTYIGKFDTVVSFYKLAPLNSVAGLIGTFFDNIVTNTAVGLIAVFIAFFLFLLTGKKYLGVLAVGVLFLILQMLIVISTFHWLLVIGAIINSVCMMVALGRHGLLGMISFWFFFEAIYLYPITFDTSSFYFPQTVLTLTVILGIAFYAFYISIAGQPIFRGSVLKELAEKID